MFKNTTDYMTTNRSNAFIAHAVKTDGWKNNYHLADDAAENMKVAIDLLSEGEYLGCRFTAGGIMEDSFIIFTSEKMKMEAQDMQCILGECVAVREKNDCDFEGGAFAEDGRWLYQLTADEEKEYQDDTSRRFMERFGRLQELMEQADASIQMNFMKDCSGNSKCSVIISLPEMMTFQMRFLLNGILPGSKIREIMTSEEMQNPETISIEWAGCIFRGMFFGMWETFSNRKEDQSDNAGIDELHLSVRSYNALKRAGINTIGQLRKMNTEQLSKIRFMGKKSVEEVEKVLDEYDRNRKPEDEEILCEEEPEAEEEEVVSENETTDDEISPIDQLAELIGLENVKKQVCKIVCYARMKNDMKAAGLDKAGIVLNMMFTGNPGTAKTTVARIMARILKLAGIITSDELVEVGRADLVGKYVGHTATQVQEIFRKAKGGMLFIDEAYSLIEEWENSYGDEAINTIVQEMENNREDTIVVFAGYSDRMKEFIQRNPGLRSRVPFTIDFEDYSADELAQITALEVTKRSFTLAEGAEGKVLEICERASGKAEAGNGRFCRNLVDDAILNYAFRVYLDEEAGEEKNFVLQAEDFDEAILKQIETEEAGEKEKAVNREIRHIGFRCA